MKLLNDTERAELARSERDAHHAAALEYERFRATIADEVFARTAAAPKLHDLQRAMGMPAWLCTGDDDLDTRLHAERLLGRTLAGLSGRARARGRPRARAPP